MENQELIDKLTSRNIKVRAAFEKEYIRDNPPPDSDDRLILIGIKASLAASWLLSALLTIPSFARVMQATGMGRLGEIAGGIAGFVAIDFFLVISTYYLIATRYRLSSQLNAIDSTVSQVQSIMLLSSIFTFFVSIGSNLYFVIIGYSIVDLDSVAFMNISRMVAILLGLAPAVQSVTTASVFALLPLTKEVLMKQWRNHREEYWKRVRKTHYGYQDLSSAIEHLQTPREKVHEHFMKVHESHEIVKRRTPTREKVHEYLNAHDNPLDTTITEISDALGLSIGLVSEEKRNWLHENE